MIEPIVSRLEQLVVEEKRRSYAKERYFHSPHEAESVVREEVEEMLEAATKAAEYYKVLWFKVRSDNDLGNIVPRELRKEALNAAAEAIQAAAMCDKLMESEVSWEDKEWNRKK